MGRAMGITVHMDHGALPHRSCPMSFPIPYIKQLQRLPVQGCLHQPVTAVGQLQGKEGGVLIYQAVENLIPFPDI